MRPATPKSEIFKLAQKAYERGVITVDLHDQSLVMDDWLKQGLINWADRVYGGKKS